jgi:hypothetical protein
MQRTPLNAPLLRCHEVRPAMSLMGQQETHALQQSREGSTARTIINFIEKASWLYEQKRRPGSS